MGYAVGTFGNHEFDWGKQTLIDRLAEATFPHVSANIVRERHGQLRHRRLDGAIVRPSLTWSRPSASAPNQVKVAFTGVTTPETPIITIASATEGLCFKDPAASITRLYDEMKAQADVIVVLSHLGFNDGGYGYGIPVIGDKTLAQKLIDAGKPANLIIGGHSHHDLYPLSDTDPTRTKIAVVGNTTVVQAHYNGRKVGRADFTFDPATKAVTVAWQRLVVSTTGEKDPVVDAVIQSYANDPAYKTLVGQPIGYSAVDLPRSNTGDNMMATFIDDAIYNYLNTDAEPANDVDLFFNNAGGIRTDWCYVGGAWSGTGCVAGIHDPGLLTYGNMFTVLPFGNATAVGNHDRRPDPGGGQLRAERRTASSSRRASSTSTSRTRTPNLGRSPTPGAPSTSASSTRPPRRATRLT